MWGIQDTGLRVVCFNAANTSLPRADDADWPRVTAVGFELPGRPSGFALVEPLDEKWELVEGIRVAISGRGTVAVDFAMVARPDLAGWFRKGPGIPGHSAGPAGDSWQRHQVLRERTVPGYVAQPQRSESDGPDDNRRHRQRRGPELPGRGAPRSFEGTRPLGQSSARGPYCTLSEDTLTGRATRTARGPSGRSFGRFRGGAIVPPRAPVLQNAFRIGESHQVEPSLNSVTGPVGTVRLEPKVMQVLVLLAAHAGQVVAKERLMATVWPDTFVTDDVLTRAISELRRVSVMIQRVTIHPDDPEKRLSVDCSCVLKRCGPGKPRPRTTRALRDCGGGGDASRQIPDDPETTHARMVALRKGLWATGLAAVIAAAVHGAGSAQT